MKFELTGDQEINYLIWKVEHDKICSLKDKDGTIGGRISFVFNPTGVGVGVDVKCGCGEKLDLTNYDEW